MPITIEQFKQATGTMPTLDDMDMVNCPDQGHQGHMLCGWCNQCNKPRFICEHYFDIYDPSSNYEKEW
jgi:hypothetical protein